MAKKLSEASEALLQQVKSGEFICHISKSSRHFDKGWHLMNANQPTSAVIAKPLIEAGLLEQFNYRNPLEKTPPPHAVYYRFKQKHTVELTQVKPKKYVGHVYVVVRVQSDPVKANNPREAAEKILKDIDAHCLDNLFRVTSSSRPFVSAVDYADERQEIAIDEIEEGKEPEIVARFNIGGDKLNEIEIPVKE